MKIFAIFVFIPLIMFVAKILDLFVVLVSDIFFRSYFWKFLKAYLFSATLGASFYFFYPFSSLGLYIFFSILLGAYMCFVVGYNAFKNKNRAENTFRQEAVVSYSREIHASYLFLVFVPLGAYFNLFFTTNLLAIFTYPARFLLQIMSDYSFLNFLSIAIGILSFLYYCPILGIIFKPLIDTVLGRNYNSY